MVISKNKLLIELINNQRDNIDSKKKLDIKDLHRICKNLNSSIFSINKDNDCCLWCGYVTNIASSNTHYVNFFFKKKKYALHRLLYENFIGDINKSEYLRFSCENKGVCCNLDHIKKIAKNTYIKSDLESDLEIEAETETETETETEIETEKQGNEKDIVLNKNLESNKKNIKKSKDNSIEVIETKNKLIIIF